MQFIMGDMHRCCLSKIITLLMLTVSQFTLSYEQAIRPPPPLPILPLPNHAQLQWQQREMIMFFHFGVNTYTGREWGYGDEDPDIFNPTSLNINQWIETAIQTGFSLVLLTAKHHDGFCLWPSKYSEFSVKKSVWKNGEGDFVGEFVTTAKAHGLDVGFYLSPWERRESRFSTSDSYNEYYLSQLQELLSNYGSVKEMWFDGARGSYLGNISYNFNEWFGMVKALQGSINIFSDAGPDIRWVGNERGAAGTTCWSTINRTSIFIGSTDEKQRHYLNVGDERGTNWVPPVCDVSLRAWWFYHEEDVTKTISELLEIYYNSVGRNCMLVLNVSPNKEGLISERDVLRLKEFRNAIDTIFSTNLAENCSIKASSQRGDMYSGFGAENVLDNDHLWTYWAPNNNDDGPYWIELTTNNGSLLKFNVVRIQEAIGLGQRIEQHEIYVDGIKIIEATTVGYKKLHRLEKGVVEGNTVKIQIIGSRAKPLISSLGLYFDPFWSPDNLY